MTTLQQQQLDEAIEKYKIASAAMDAATEELGFRVAPFIEEAKKNKDQAALYALAEQMPDPVFKIMIQNAQLF